MSKIIVEISRIKYLYYYGQYEECIAKASKTYG
jgi:hypothetical protein